MGRQFNALVADEEEQVLEVVVVFAYQDVEHQPAKQRYPREGFVAAVRNQAAECLQRCAGMLHHAGNVQQLAAVQHMAAQHFSALQPVGMLHLRFCVQAVKALNAICG